jgi:hypothetical protein
MSLTQKSCQRGGLKATVRMRGHLAQEGNKEAADKSDDQATIKEKELTSIS